VKKGHPLILQRDDAVTIASCVLLDEKQAAYHEQAGEFLEEPCGLHAYRHSCFGACKDVKVLFGDEITGHTH
jgi:hypothetical protein